MQATNPPASRWRRRLESNEWLSRANLSPKALVPPINSQLAAKFSDRAQSHLGPSRPRKRLDEVLIGGGQNAMQSHHEQVIQQMRPDLLGPAPHVFLLASSDAFKRRPQFPLRFHRKLTAARRLHIAGSYHLRWELASALVFDRAADKMTAVSRVARVANRCDKIRRRRKTSSREFRPGRRSREKVSRRGRSP